MKKIYFFYFLFLLVNMSLYAAPRYWVGPVNGNWNDAANWSATNGGAGGAGVPGVADDAIFNIDASVNVDISPTVNKLEIAIFTNVILYTSVPTELTIAHSLVIAFNAVLKDSTAADVPFNFIFDATTKATASIYGNWIFEGGVPVTGTNGATFTADPGTQVVMRAIFPTGGGGGTISLRNNTGAITAFPSSLIFGYNTMFILENNPEGIIPNATWYGDSLRSPAYGGLLSSAAATLMITGKIGVLKHGAALPSYGRVVVDLALLTQDASLALTNGSSIKGNLDILNTNNYTLTLLAPTSATSLVEVEVGMQNNAFNFAGNLNIRGNTKVALAKSTSAAPATSYRLQVSKSFNQSGGNFSLQDFDGALGASTLAVRRDLIQTGGTFHTNSTATGPDTKFIVEMDDPPFIAGPSGLFSSLAKVNMSSGTIDNGRSMVTLRVNHSLYSFPAFPNEPNGVSLESPLEVGRLELVRSPLTTTATNILTVTDFNQATGIIVGNTGKSYVNGPMRRYTNSPMAYIFPTGKGNTSPASSIYDPVIIEPTAKDHSLYQAEYYKNGFNDTDNLSTQISGVSSVEYWDITRAYGADASITLNHNTPVPGATNQHVMLFAYYEQGVWNSADAGSGESIWGDDSSGSVSSLALSNIGAVTFGYALGVVPPVYVNCPSDTIVNTGIDSCTALVRFKAEAGKRTRITYKLGSKVISSPYAFESGTSIVDVIASNASGSDTCFFKVNVNDLQAPSITGGTANPATLSPADNELKNVFVDYAVTDNCGPVVTTLSVTSNQPINDGVDWEIIDNHNVRLRATASNEDRVYLITITSTDTSGNQTKKAVGVTVPFEMSITKEAGLEVEVMPNPSKTYFTLQVNSSSDRVITMQVLDLHGRIKEVRKFYANATIRLGHNHKPGTYFVKFTQGNKGKYITLIKLPG